MQRIEPANPHDHWTIRTEARAGKPGSAEVIFRLTNQAFGDLPEFTIHADWMPGHELCDAEAHATGLAAQSAYCLAQALLDHAVTCLHAGD